MSESPNPGDDSLAFAPAPTASTRHDGWTPDCQRGFIAELASHGGVAAAARAVGMTPQSANRLRRRPGAESFAGAWDAALLQGRDNSRDEAIARGRDGWLSPVMRRGEIVGQRRRYDNRLLFAACYGEPLSRFTRDPG
jgi:hypothetical protein